MSNFSPNFVVTKENNNNTMHNSDYISDPDADSDFEPKKQQDKYVLALEPDKKQNKYTSVLELEKQKRRRNLMSDFLLSKKLK